MTLVVASLLYSDNHVPLPFCSLCVFWFSDKCNEIPSAKDQMKRESKFLSWGRGKDASPQNGHSDKSKKTKVVVNETLASKKNFI